jgi:hypothetical protein
MSRPWWKQLPADQRREYERSEAMGSLDLAPQPAFARLVRSLILSLEEDDQLGTQRAAFSLSRRICHALSTRAPMVSVEGVRPPDGEGELHGLYQPSSGPEPDHITVWMRTAQREAVVAPRTFLRTLLHEIGHHLDMHSLGFPHSFHTRGFYRRESALYRAVTDGTPIALPRRRERSRKPDPPVDVERGLAVLRRAMRAIDSRRKGD